MPVLLFNGHIGRLARSTDSSKIWPLWTIGRLVQSTDPWLRLKTYTGRLGRSTDSSKIRPLWTIGRLLRSTGKIQRPKTIYRSTTGRLPVDRQTCTWDTCTLPVHRSTAGRPSVDRQTCTLIRAFCQDSGRLGRSTGSGQKLKKKWNFEEILIFIKTILNINSVYNIKTDL